MQGWQYGKGLIYYVIKVHPYGTTHGFVAVDLLTFYRYFEKGCRKKCTRQPRKVLWVVLSALFFKEI